MKASIRTIVCLLALLVLSASIPTQTIQAQSAAPAALTSLEKFFGFQMGADRKLAGRDKLHEYYQLLAKTSNRVKLVELGKSSEVRPFIALFISSPANLARLGQSARRTKHRARRCCTRSTPVTTTTATASR